MKNKSFLIVSKDGRPVRRVKINFFTVFLTVVFIGLGTAAYFIPANMFRLQTTELKQKKELRAQNSQLHERFPSTLRVLNRAKEQIDSIEAKKESVAALTGTAGIKDRTDRPDAPRERSSPAYSDVKPASLYAHLCSRDSAVSAFAASVPQGKNPFEYIPVCKPVQSGAVLSRGFGPSMDPFTGQKKQHNGVDFAAPTGTPVIATASGYVARVEAAAIWGKRLVIEHGNGLSTVYAHLGSVCAGRGRSVKRGAVIGYIGLSGLASGPHVHYEIWRNSTALDPEEVFFPSSGK